MSGSFIDQRWGIEVGGRGEETKEKTISFLQISPIMTSLRQGDMLVSLPYSPAQVSRARLSPCEPKAPLPKGQAQGARQGFLRQAIVYACNNKAMTNLDSILKSRDITF